jgi:AraC-like DNA-binding protein
MRGFPVSELLQRVGIDERETTERDGYVPHSSLLAFLEAAVETTGDHALGPHAAEAVRPGDFHVLEYAAGSCDNLGDSMRCATRYLRLMHAGMLVWLVIEDDMAYLHFAAADGVVMSPVGIEFIVASFLMFGRRYTGMNLRPVEVDFRHAGPTDSAEHERVFGGHVKFGASRNAMCFPAEALALPHAHADRTLREILVQHAEHLLSQVPHRPSFSQRVRELIAGELRGGNPGVEHIATKLNISARTLHRRLKYEGTTHKRLTDELRKNLAVGYLSERDISIGEISFLLGFSHPNAFHKAFKRWLGETPSQYRAKSRRR